MSVAGQNLAKSTIMFFPYDVKKARLNISIGQKLRFVPKTEGYTIVATNLQEVTSSEEESVA